MKIHTTHKNQRHIFSSRIKPLREENWRPDLVRLCRSIEMAPLLFPPCLLASALFYCGVPLPGLIHLFLFHSSVATPFIRFLRC